MAESSGQNRFGPYLVQEKLGGGGMAVVYKAWNEQANRTVALKVMRASIASEPGVMERFQLEAEIANRLKHPHIVAMYDHGELHGRHYLEMQYIPGGTLAHRFRRPVDLHIRDAIRMLRDVAGALDFAHAQGVVHRDLKLENILLDHSGTAYLGDFGIARITTQAARLTATGGVIGTPLYIAPEQVKGQIADYRADLYALAVVAYVLTVGRYPFDNDNVMAILNAHVAQSPPPPSQVVPDLPARLDAVILKGLAKRPEDRYQSADAFVEALSRAFEQADVFSTHVDLTNISQLALQYEAPDPQSADEWVDKALVTADRDEAISYLRRALEIEPLHSKANRLLFQWEGAKPKANQTNRPMLANNGNVAARVLQAAEAQKPNGGFSWAWTLAFGVVAVLLVAVLIFAIGNSRGAFRPPLVVTLDASVPNQVMTVMPTEYKQLLINGEVTGTLNHADVLDYQFAVKRRELYRIVVSIGGNSSQLFSDNVAIYHSDGSVVTNCNVSHADTILLIQCPIDTSGTWHLRLLGVTGKSTGNYKITTTRLVAQ